MNREYESPVSSVVAWVQQSVICDSKYDQNNLTEILLIEEPEDL